MKQTFPLFLLKHLKEVISYGYILFIIIIIFFFTSASFFLEIYSFEHKMMPSNLVGLS